MTRKSAKARKKSGGGGNRGFIVITSFLFLSILSVFFVALLARNNIFLQATERNQNRAVAFHTAEAGLDWVLRQLEIDPSLRNQSATQDVTMSYRSLNTNFVQGGYGLLVGPADPNNPNPNSNLRRVVVAGHAPVNTSAAPAYQCPTTAALSLVLAPRAYECRSVSAFAQVQPPSPFDSAVFAEEEFEMKNGIIDSYNSTVGPYSAATAGSNAEVRTNSTERGAVALTGNATLKGNAVVGPGGDPQSVIQLGPRAVITGSRTAAREAEKFEGPTAPQTAVYLGSLNISGNTNYQLAAGVYRADSIKITGQGQLTPIQSGTNQKVEIYVSGTTEIGGRGVATIGNLPTNFILYGTASGEVKLSGGSNFYGGVFTPSSKVENKGSGDFFGALVSEEYKQTGGGNIHFDEAMKVVPAPGAGDYESSLKSWQEANTVAAS